MYRYSLPKQRNSIIFLLNRERSVTKYIHIVYLVTKRFIMKDSIMLLLNRERSATMYIVYLVTKRFIMKDSIMLLLNRERSTTMYIFTLSLRGLSWRTLSCSFSTEKGCATPNRRKPITRYSLILSFIFYVCIFTSLVNTSKKLRVLNKYY